MTHKPHGVVWLFRAKSTGDIGVAKEDGRERPSSMVCTKLLQPRDEYSLLCGPRRCFSYSKIRWATICRTTPLPPGWCNVAMQPLVSAVGFEQQSVAYPAVVERSNAIANRLVNIAAGLGKRSDAFTLQNGIAILNSHMGTQLLRLYHL